MKKLPKPKKKIEFVPSLAKQEMNALVTRLSQASDRGIFSYQQAQSHIAYALEEVLDLLNDIRKLRQEYVIADTRSRFLPLSLLPILEKYTREKISPGERKKTKEDLLEAIDIYLPMASFTDMKPSVNPKYIFRVQEKRYAPELADLDPYELYGYGW